MSKLLLIIFSVIFLINYGKATKFLFIDLLEPNAAKDSHHLQLLEVNFGNCKEDLSSVRDGHHITPTAALFDLNMKNCVGRQEELESLEMQVKYAFGRTEGGGKMSETKEQTLKLNKRAASVLQALYADDSMFRLTANPSGVMDIKLLGKQNQESQIPYFWTKTTSSQEGDFVVRPGKLTFKIEWAWEYTTYLENVTIEQFPLNCNMPMEIKKRYIKNKYSVDNFKLDWPKCPGLNNAEQLRHTKIRISSWDKDDRPKQIHEHTLRFENLAPEMLQQLFEGGIAKILIRDANGETANDLVVNYEATLAGGKIEKHPGAIQFTIPKPCGRTPTLDYVDVVQRLPSGAIAHCNPITELAESTPKRDLYSSFAVDWSHCYNKIENAQQLKNVEIYVKHSLVAEGTSEFQNVIRLGQLGAEMWENLFNGGHAYLPERYGSSVSHSNSPASKFIFIDLLEPNGVYKKHHLKLLEFSFGKCKKDLSLQKYLHDSPSAAYLYVGLNYCADGLDFTKLELHLKYAFVDFDNFNRQRVGDAIVKEQTLKMGDLPIGMQNGLRTDYSMFRLEASENGIPNIKFLKESLKPGISKFTVESALENTKFDHAIVVVRKNVEYRKEFKLSRWYKSKTKPTFLVNWENYFKNEGEQLRSVQIEIHFKITDAKGNTTIQETNRVLSFVKLSPDMLQKLFSGADAKISIRDEKNENGEAQEPIVVELVG